MDFSSGNIGSVQDNYEKYKDMFTTEKNNVVTMDSFYELLIAEMQNQDPLEPTTNTEFISQMATFTSLQATQDNFDMQQQNYAKTLVGQSVGINDGGEKMIQGVVDYVTFGDEVMVSVGGKSYPLSSVKMIQSGGEATDAGSQISNYGAFASSLIGKNIVVQATDGLGMPIIDEGIASSIEIQDGMVRVVLNGYAYNVTDVVAVSEAKAPEGGQDGADEAEPVTKPEETEKPNEVPADSTADEDIQDLEDEEDIALLKDLFGE